MQEIKVDACRGLEIAFWESAKDGDRQELSSYLEHYAEGTFASPKPGCHRVLSRSASTSLNTTPLQGLRASAVRELLPRM